MPEIIPVMKDLGYTPTEEGVCFGIAVMGAQAVIREEPRVFYNRIRRIHNLTDETIETIVKEKALGKTDDLFYFFDGVSVYHGLSAITEEVKKTSHLAISRQSIGNKFLFKHHNDATKTKEIQDKKTGFVDIKKRLVCYITIKKMNQFILKLKTKLKNKSFSLVIYYADVLHTVQLGYSNNNWLVVNHDFVEIYKENDDIDNITRGLFLHLNKNLKQDKEYQLNALIDIVLSEQVDIDLSWVKKYQLSSSQITKLKQNKQLLVDLINSCAYANQYQILEKIFRHVDIVTIANEMINNKLPVTMLLAEISDSHIETTNALFKVIKESKLSMLESVRLLKGCANGFDSLSKIVWRGNTKTLNAFLQLIDEISLSNELRMSLYQANNRQNRSILYLAAYQGYTEIFKSILASIQRAKFDKIKLFSLLEGKDRNGISILSVAAEKGYMDITVALMQAIDNACFSAEEKITLLESRNKKSLPVLLAAFAQGRIEIVKYLIEYILSSNINADKKIELLQASMPSLKTSLYQYAKKSANRDFVKYFEDTIANSPQLTKIQKKQILQF